MTRHLSAIVLLLTLLVPLGGQDGAKGKPDGGNGGTAKPFTAAPPVHQAKNVSVPDYDPAHLQFPRGLTPTPRHVLASAMRYSVPTTSPPSQVIFLAPKLSYLGNDQYGDCVTAQEAASMMFYSVQCGLPQTVVTDATAIAWARKYGYLNGANLPPVMDKMAAVGMQATDGSTYKDGPYLAVDYSNEQALQSAIATGGPVNCGIDANALPSAAGNYSGWFGYGGRPGQFSNEDHCVPIVGYGPTADVFKQISLVYGKQVAPPANAPATSYIVYTWSTVGAVDHAWIMSTMGEAWARNPTTVGRTPGPPQPPVTGAPSITSAATSTATVGVPWSYQITATNSPTSWGTSVGAVNATGLVTNTFTVAGVNNVQIAATNASGTGSAILVVTVGTTPVPPTPTPSQRLTITLGGKTLLDGELYPLGTKESLDKANADWNAWLKSMPVAPTPTPLQMKKTPVVQPQSRIDLYREELYAAWGTR